MITQKVFIVVKTPDGEHLCWTVAEALERAGDALVREGWRDGYEGRLTVEVRGHDITADPH